MKHRLSNAGFTLLPVVLAMSLVAAIAFLLNRDNGMNTEMLLAQSSQDKARYAAEAGLQAVNAKIQALGCGGSFPVTGNPVTNADFGGASYSAYATTGGGNTTGLVSTGSYNGTSVKLTRNNIYVYQTAPKTYTLQPDGTAGIDTYLVKNSTTNYGNSTTINLNSTSNFPLFRFDLSMFPSGSLPVSTSLALYAGSGLGWGTGSIHRVQSAWQEGTGAASPIDGANWTTMDGTLPWATAGGSYHAASIDSDDAVTGSSMTFDAADLTYAWLSGRYPNHGVQVKMMIGVGSLNFTSSDNADTAHRPKLTFNYLLPCGATGPADPIGGTLTLNAIADTFDNSAAVQANNGQASTLVVSRSSTQDRRTLISFNTSAIPAGSTIDTAVLRLYVASVANASTNTKSIWVNAVNNAWAEGTGNNTNKACPGAATPGASWNYSTNCTNWSYIHPPNSAPVWAAMAPMPTARSAHMVASVGGKIYAIGGYNNSYLKVVEEYNPATNTWATKAPMLTARSEAAVAVVNGKIYVMGGDAGGLNATNRNEVYDPSTDTWTNLATMINGRKYMGAAVVNNKIYALGGAKSVIALKNNEEYDPSSNTWATKTQMPTARQWFAAQSANGKVYAIGGWSGLLDLTANEEFNPSTNSWTTRASLPTATDSMGSAVLGNRIYLIAGMQGNTVINKVWAYDVLTNTYTAQADYPTLTEASAAVGLNGYVYSLGGDNYASTYYNNHYRYDPGVPTPIATATDETTGNSPPAAGFAGGWITFELKTLVKEWVDGVRPNTGIVVYTEIPDQFNINSREGASKTPQLVVTYSQ